AVGAHDVWAVGLGGQPTQPVAEHWNGSTWSVVSVPSPVDSSFALLNAVSAVSAKDIWAVGRAEGGSGTVTLAEHWDGDSWTIAPTTNRPDNLNGLDGVAAVATGDVWSVGTSTAAP